MSEDKALATMGIVTPAVNAEEAVKAWNEYVALCKAIIAPEDVQKTGDRDYRKKSAFRKLARFYNLTDKVVDSEIQRDDLGRPTFAAFTVRATAPNGREAEGYHECHLTERCCPAAFEEDCSKSGNHRHCKAGCTGWSHWSHPGDIPATAHTRAKNRAISDLIGAGEVSAEEVGDIAPERDEAQSTQEVAAPRGLCPVHKLPFVHRTGIAQRGPNKGKPYDFWACSADVKPYCQEKPADAPAPQAEAPAAVVVGGQAAPVAQVPEVVPVPRETTPKSIAEMMQRAKTELKLPWAEARQVIGDPGMIVDIPAAWAKLCEAAKAKTGTL